MAHFAPFAMSAKSAAPPGIGSEWNGMTHLEENTMALTRARDTLPVSNDEVPPYLKSS